MTTIPPRFPQTDMSQLQARSGTLDGDTFASSVLAECRTRIILQPEDVPTAQEIVGDIGAVRE